MRILESCIVIAVSILTVSMFLNAGENDKLKDVLEIVKLIMSDKHADRLIAVNREKDRRNKLISELSEIIEAKNSGKYHERSRAAAAYLLGKLRASEAVNALSSALKDEPCTKEFRPGSFMYRSPVFNALTSIGRPCVPEMIKIIRNSDDQAVTRKSALILGHESSPKGSVVSHLHISQACNERKA